MLFFVQNCPLLGSFSKNIKSGYQIHFIYYIKIGTLRRKSKWLAGLFFLFFFFRLKNFPLLYRRKWTSEKLPTFSRDARYNEINTIVLAESDSSNVHPSNMIINLGVASADNHILRVDILTIAFSRILHYMGLAIWKHVFGHMRAAKAEHVDSD